jgi:hypothetical protein
MKRKINITSASPRGWHRLQLATECLQKYAFSYEETVSEEGHKQKQEPTKSAGLIRGSLMHLALAQHYSIMRTLQEGGERDEWSEPETAVTLIAQRDGWTKYLDEVLTTYRDYCKVYPFEREIKTHRIVAVEDLYQTMIGGKYLLTGRLDLAYENQAGQIIVCDHKTSGRITKAHESYYSTHGQLFGYLHLAKKHFGEDKVAGFKVNLIEVSHTPKFNRMDLNRAPLIESTFEQIVIDIEERIEHMKAQNRPLEEWPKSINELTCYSRYGACTFRDRCKFGMSATEWNWSDDE